VTLLEKAASSCSKHRATKSQSSIIVPQFDQISATRFTTEYLIAKGNLKEASKILRTEVSKTGKTKTSQLYMDIVRGIAVRNNVTTHPGEITKIWHRFDPVLQTICTEGKEIP